MTTSRTYPIFLAFSLLFWPRASVSRAGKYSHLIPLKLLVGNVNSTISSYFVKAIREIIDPLYRAAVVCRNERFVIGPWMVSASFSPQRCCRNLPKPREEKQKGEKIGSTAKPKPTNQSIIGARRRLGTLSMSKSYQKGPLHYANAVSVSGGSVAMSVLPVD